MRVEIGKCTDITGMKVTVYPPGFMYPEYKAKYTGAFNNEDTDPDKVEERNKRRAKATQKGGERKRAYLTEEQQKAIAKDDRPQKEIAEEYGIKENTVYNIKWKAKKAVLI